MHPEIEKAIMGHSQRGLSVHEGYGMISDEELVKAIDAMTFDHGETQILAPAKKTKPTKSCNSGSAEKQVQNVSTPKSRKSAHAVTL